MKSESAHPTNSAPLEEATLEFGLEPATRSHSAAKFTHRVLTVRTSTKFELLNLTAQVQDAVKAAGVREGLVLVSSMHTTLALMMNEWQNALLADLKEMIASIIPADREYHHNDPKQSDCDRKNAHSHLQATLLGHALSFGVVDGRLSLGQFQAIIGAELDGPRERQVTVQIFSFS